MSKRDCTANDAVSLRRGEWIEGNKKTSNKSLFPFLSTPVANRKPSNPHVKSDK